MQERNIDFSKGHEDTIQDLTQLNYQEFATKAETKSTKPDQQNSFASHTLDNSSDTHQNLKKEVEEIEKWMHEPK